MRFEESLVPFRNYLQGAGRTSYTITDYETRIKRFLVWLEEHYSEVHILNELTPEIMDEYAQHLYTADQLFADHPNRKTVQGRGYSKATIAGYILGVKTWIAFCFDRGYIDRNVAHHLQKPGWVPRPSAERVMRRSDLYRMLDQARDKALESGNPRDLAMLMFAAETGCRRGEIADLRVKDLVLESCTAWVDGKTGGRMADYTEKTAGVLMLWLQLRWSIVEAFGGGHDYVFCGVNPMHTRSYGRPLTYSGVYQIFKRLAIDAGVKGKYNPHSVRHLVGQSWVDQGLNLELLRQKLGHSSIETTAAFYTHQDLSRVRAATKLASLLNGYRADIDPDQLT